MPPLISHHAVTTYNPALHLCCIGAGRYQVSVRPCQMDRPAGRCRCGQTRWQVSTGQTRGQVSDGQTRWQGLDRPAGRCRLDRPAGRCRCGRLPCRVATASIGPYKWPCVGAARARLPGRSSNGRVWAPTQSNVDNGFTRGCQICLFVAGENMSRQAADSHRARAICMTNLSLVGAARLRAHCRALCRPPPVRRRRGVTPPLRAGAMRLTALTARRCDGRSRARLMGSVTL